MRLPSRWLLLLALAIGPTPARALDIVIAATGSGRNLTLRGEIARGDSDRIERLLRASGPVDAVRLDSTGGSLSEGIALGRLLRRHRLPARVPEGAICTSACVYAFAGAQHRQVARGGRIGVHMFSSAYGTDILAMISELVREHGQQGAAIVVRRLEQRSAAMAHEQASYLKEMSISLALMIPTFATRPDDIRWLSRDELRAFNLVDRE